MDFFNHSKKLFGSAFLLFITLTVLIAIIPALNNQDNNAPLPNSVPLSSEAIKGKAIYISNGCVACHTQQVRNVDMDKVWGDRPSIAADYADNHRLNFLTNTATLMGTERTGPDLSNIGTRQPSIDWNLVHLYNPRIVVKESIMPAYPWLFEKKLHPSKKDVVVNVPNEFMPEKEGKIIASKDALYLIAYLQSLKQVKLPDGSTNSEFLYKKEEKTNNNNSTTKIDGKTIFTNNCQSCHQANGEGLKGAFPPLKGSQIVLSNNLELYVNIIMNGYDATQSFGVMPAVGKNANFNENDVAALINYERTSWGNNGKLVTPDEIKKIMDFIKINAPKE